MLVDEFHFDPGYWHTISLPDFQAWQRLAGERRFRRSVEARNQQLRADHERRQQKLQGR